MVPRYAVVRLHGFSNVQHGDVWAKCSGYDSGPAADSPLLPPEKQKQSKLQRRAPNAKAVLIE